MYPCSGPANNLYRIDASTRLRRAISRNDAVLVRRILKSHTRLLHNPDISPAGLSNSSLHLAASLGHLDVCRELLELGHEVPCPALNEHHQTALMLAAAAGHTDVVHFLAQADPTCILRRDSHGRDAIMEASRGGYDTCLQILLTLVPGGATAAVQRADVDGNTSLHFASAFGHQPVLRTLLAAGANPDVRNSWNWLPSAYSATVQSEVYLKGLIQEMERRGRPTRNWVGGGVRAVDKDDPDVRP